MPVYLSTATLGNERTLLTLGHSAEIMAWFFPHKDHAQHIHECLVAVYHGAPYHGHLHWAHDAVWQRHQYYLGDSNVCVTELTSHGLNLQLVITDVVPPGDTVLLRRIEARNIGSTRVEAGVFIYGDWNLGAVRMGNAIRYEADNLLVQTHHDASLCIGGDALETWQCGKAGENWGSNARYDLNDGRLNCQKLEIGDVNVAFGFNVDLSAGESATRLAVFALNRSEYGAMEAVKNATARGFEAALQDAQKADAAWLARGLETLKGIGASLPDDLEAAYRRSLLCLPLLCGEEGVAVAAPEFDPEFISCGGYGYHWPRDGGEYVSGLIDAGYPEFTDGFFDWCARHQDPSGLWHQRYFLNGQPGPNWCLPPETLQIDQVGAVLWALGKVIATKVENTAKSPGAASSGASAITDEGSLKIIKAAASVPSEKIRALEKKALEKLRANNAPTYKLEIVEMVRKAADYLVSRQTERGVHGNAFDTWETFVGSFTYSNAAIHAGLKTAAAVTGETKYDEAAARLKAGVLQYFVKGEDYPYLVRGFDGNGNDDWTVDSASLGAIEPFELLDLTDARDLEIAEGTLRAITERLDVEWQGGRAIRRFEGDAYVGGVPACVNTLWMARCCLHLANRFDEIGRSADADELTRRAQVYLQTVLRRATPTGLLPELMQGPTGQNWWAAPHGWAMSSFVSGTLMLARRMAKKN